MKCPECGGTGVMPIQWTLGLNGICDACNGSGKVIDEIGEEKPEGMEESK